ncbi:type VI secretion system Vgr family protein [Variovorax sp. RHLX14]|uniref:type VI secretion system Vgr family protein n=1 Tax=Variovorax sp. RHLX14 TaxID=1259731 RepID=UPI003F456EB9
MLIFVDEGDALRRTLRVRLPAFERTEKSGRASVLQAWTPVRLSGREGVNSLFCYQLDLKADEAEGSVGGVLADAIDVDLDGWVGGEIGCCIELDGAGLREINSIVTEACLWGEEGRHVQIRLTLKPWLHLATLRTDCRIFQNKTVVQILDEVLVDYGFPVEKRLVERYPVRDFQTQFNETDFEFVARLCAEWGISYHFEHGRRGSEAAQAGRFDDDDDADASVGPHRLVLTDTIGAFSDMPNAACRNVEYHPPGWKTDSEYLHSFAPVSRLTSGRYSTRDYDYLRPRADLSVSQTDPGPTAQADGEVYRWHADSHYAQPGAGAAAEASGPNDVHDEARQIALVRMEALRTAGVRVQASGNLRGMVPGFVFRLVGHPREAANVEHLVIDANLLIEDVGQDSQRRVDGNSMPGHSHRSQHWQVRADLVLHPVKEPLRPEGVPAKPFSHGPQTALVVGPEGQDIWTDSLGRIKVHFFWDRIGQKNQNSTCWLRVSSPWAGNQLGGIQLPRVGQEVLVSFIGGDPDLPICTGRVHNQMNMPPWALPGQSALSGFRSRELTAGYGNSAFGRSNHLVLDDTAKKIQVQLKSDHLSSSLGLGYLTRIEDNAGRKDARGEGFELRTDGHGVLRAGDGMLISTEARTKAIGHAKELTESVARLAAAQDQHAQLSDAAKQAQAQNGGDQDAVADALHAQCDEIKGSRGKASGPGSANASNRSASCNGTVESTFPELAQPHLVLASAAGIESTAAESTHIASGTHTAITSGGHTSISAGRSFLASARDAIRLFAAKTGMRLIAASGDIDITALQNAVHLLAKLEITHTAERITITAKEEVLINGAGSYSRWNSAGITHGTKGAWTAHAAGHGQIGPDGIPVVTPPMATGTPKARRGFSS